MTARFVHVIEYLEAMGGGFALRASETFLKFLKMIMILKQGTPGPGGGPQVFERKMAPVEMSDH